MAKPPLDDLRQQYEEVLPGREQFCEHFKGRLDQLLKSSDIELAFPIEARVKQWNSIDEKLMRLTPSIRHISDLQDLIGLRIVVLFDRDVQHVCELLGQHLFVIRRNQTRERQREDQFGYSSDHLIVRIPDGDFNLSGYPATVEIQVRTLAQHLWASVSHLLQYKQEAAVPLDVRRSVNRVSALLETVDLEFERVLVEREHYRSGLPRPIPDAELNVDSLAAELSESWPSAHKIGNEPYALLLNDLRKSGITTTQGLRAFVAKWRERTLVRAGREAERLRSAADAYGVEGGKITIAKPNSLTTINVTPDVLERARAGVLYSHTGLTFTALQFERGERSPDEPID